MIFLIVEWNRYQLIATQSAINIFNNLTQKTAQDGGSNLQVGEKTIMSRNKCSGINTNERIQFLKKNLHVKLHFGLNYY